MPRVTTWAAPPASPDELCYWSAKRCGILTHDSTRLLALLGTIGVALMALPAQVPGQSPSPPRIVPAASLESKAVFVAQSFSFSVTATGTLPLTY